MFFTKSINFLSLIFLLTFVVIKETLPAVEGTVEKVEIPSIVNEGDIKVIDDVEGNYDILYEDDVAVLTSVNFNHCIHTREYVLVEFYAPWCGHCKSLTPEYAKAATILKAKNLTIAKVDATKENELSKEHMITGFPTIILFKNGVKQEEFNGERNTEGIVSYMLKRTDENWRPPPNSVIELTSDNFTDFLSTKPLSLVLFYATYCKHCEQMKPEYINAAKTLKEYDIPLVQIEGTLHKDIADNFKIKGWPTLQVFRHGRAFEYKGSRDEKGIVSYMREQLKDPSTLCKSRQQLDNNIERYIPTIIGCFTSKHSKFYEEFFAVSNFLRGQMLTFLHTFDRETIKSLGIEKEGVIVKKAPVFLSNYEESEVKFLDASKSGDDIAEFIRANYRPLVGQRTKANQAFFYSVRPLVVVYYDANFDHQYQKSSEIIRNKVVEVAKEFKFITFAVANEEEYEQELEAVKLGDSGADVNVVWYDHNRIKYRMDPLEDDFDGSDLRTFIHLANDDKLIPVWKSLPIPKVQEASFMTLVADNFEEVVLKSKIERDVLLYIYAPWCGYCKEFNKIFTKISKKMGKKTFLFAKLDAAGNDLYPGFEVKGYPTIFFIPAHKKQEPKLYEGDRSYNSLRSFIEENSSVILTNDEKNGQNKDEL